MLIPGNSSAWMDSGVEVTLGQALECAASGAIPVTSFSGSGGPATLASSPATFTTPGSGLYRNVTFAVPAGVYTGATWEVKGTHTIGVIVEVETGSDTLTLGSASGSTPFDFILAASPGQLADINAAAGGSLTVGAQSGGNVASITFFTLTLTTSGATSGFALPEGAYPPSFPSNPTFNPALVLQTSALTSLQIAALAATNCVPFSLILALVQVGAGPPPRGITFALQPNRDTVFTASQLQAAAVGGPGPWRIWLIFNSYDYSTSSGWFTAQLTVLNPGAFDVSDRFTVLNKTQIGMETTPGTIVPATHWIQSFNITPSIKTKMKQHRTPGSKRGDLSIAAKEWTEASIDGIASYNELPLLFASLISAPTSGLVSTGVYDHVFLSSDTAPDALKSFSVEHGSTLSAEKFGFGMVPGLAFKSTRDDIEISGSMYGQILKDSVNNSAALTVGANEQQSITLAGATGGTFTLSYLGEATTNLAWNATTAAVQTALQALSTIGSGNATVGGSAGAYVVTFAGALAALAVAPLVASAALLTPAPPTSTVTVVVSTPGGMAILSKIPVMPGDFTMYVATSWAGLGLSANVIARQFETDWSIEDRTAPFWTQNASQLSFTGYAEKEAKEQIEIVMGVDTAYAIRSNYQLGSIFYVRLGYVSQEYTIGSSGLPYQLTVDACVAIDAIKEYKDEEGIYALGYTLGFKRDPVAGMSYRATVRNGISAYTS